jgi:transposase
MENKEAAQVLYFQGWKQNRIAKLLSVSEQTVTAWARDGQWQKKRADKALQEETSNELIWKLIDHNLRILKTRIQDEWKDELIPRGDIDALYKLRAAVKNEQKAWGHYISTCRELTEYIQSKDHELAKMLLDHLDAFLDLKRRELT